MDDVELDDLGYSETGMAGAGWTEPLQSLRGEGEERRPGEQMMAGENEDEPEGEGASEEELTPDTPTPAEFFANPSAAEPWEQEP